MLSIKKLSFLVLIAMLSCKKPAESYLSSSDSIQLADTVNALEISNAEESTSEEITEIDETLLDAKYEEANRQMKQRTGSLYEVSARTNNYESMSDVTWYFDSTFSVVYYRDDWSMEGQEGASEIFLVNDQVICYSSDGSGGSSRTTIKVCEGTGGKMITEEEGQETPIEETLTDSYLDVARKELDGNLNRLISFLKDTEVTEKSDEMYTIRVENVINVGQEVTESSEVSIPKVLYEKLVE